MNRFLLAVGILVAICGAAFADDEGLFDKTKALVDSIEPRGGVYFDLKDGDIQGYTSAKLLSKDVKGYTVDGTLAYGADKAVLAGLETDILAGVSKLTGATLKVPYLTLHAGFHAGYSFEDDGISYGPSINGSVKW